ncbi:hypothetical protein IAU59_001869 [Kwoniella sp. CBS 9459]
MSTSATTPPDTENVKTPNRQALVNVLIVGAGVGGLSAAYALHRSKAFQEGLIEVRIVEKRGRGADGPQAGYPIHLSSSGRQALSALLTPEDLSLLDDARSEIPVLHDGLTVSSDTGRQVFRLVSETGCQPMVERKRVLDILSSGVGDIEYGAEVRGVKQLAGEKVAVIFADESETIADVVIGADGMFSPIRRSLQLCGSEGPIPLQKDKGKARAATDQITKTGYTTINLRTASSNVLMWIKDPRGINMIYGDSFSATMIPLSASAVYVALTVPSKWLEMDFAERLGSCDCPQTIAGAFLRDLEHSDGWSAGRNFELWSMSRTNGGRGRVVLLGDAAHGMVPFCGAGASAAIVDAVQLVNGLDLALRANDNKHTLDLSLNEFRSQSQARNDPMIARSKQLLWLAQGDGALGRLTRSMVFWGLEMKERLSSERKRFESEVKGLPDPHPG